MRLRWQRRAQKQLRRVRGPNFKVAASVAKRERQGLLFVDALREAMLDPALGHYDRGTAARLLALGDGNQAVQALLRLFFEQNEKDELYSTALTLERLSDRRAVGPLIHALLNDANPHRRHAAARALGWIQQPGRAAALALARCLVDPTQPQPAREEAAESLAYVGTSETVERLISVLRDSDVRIRFWAVFGLGSSCRGDARALRGLESVLADNEVPPGNWWSVGKEALALLGGMEPPFREYAARLVEETERVLSSGSATEADRRWAECYGPGDDGERGRG